MRIYRHMIARATITLVAMWVTVWPQGLYAFTFENNRTFSLFLPLTLKWKSELPSPNSLPLTTYLDTIYQSQEGGSLCALKIKSGELLWRSDIGGRITAPVITDESAVYLTSEHQSAGSTPQSPRFTGFVRALSRTSGITTWVTSLPTAIIGQFVGDARNLYGLGRDGRIYALKRATGDILWVSAPDLSPISQVSMNQELLIALTGNSSLLAIKAETGKQAWRYQTQSPVKSEIVIHPSAIYFGSEDGYINAIGVMRGRVRVVRRGRVGTGVQTISPLVNGLIVTTLDNFAYLLSTQDGRRIWKRQLPGRVAGRPLLTRDAVLFATTGANTCLAYSLREGRQINTIFVGDDNYIVSQPVLLQNTLIIPTRAGLFAYASSN